MIIKLSYNALPLCRQHVHLHGYGLDQASLGDVATKVETLLEILLHLVAEWSPVHAAISHFSQGAYWYTTPAAKYSHSWPTRSDLMTSQRFSALRWRFTRSYALFSIIGGWRSPTAYRRFPDLNWFLAQAFCNVETEKSSGIVLGPGPIDSCHGFLQAAGADWWSHFIRQKGWTWRSPPLSRVLLSKSRPDDSICHFKNSEIHQLAFAKHMTSTIRLC